MNQLFYGDNLDVLRRHVESESVDLIYLDPPFNSKQDYNVLFAEQDGSRSAAQIKAFGDTWRWDQGAEAACVEMIEAGGKVSIAIQALRQLLGSNDMMAYIAMMAPRLIETRRVLKPNGSIYLHCDPTASHYLRILMDAVFGPEKVLNEIVWKRTHSHGGAKRYGPIHDTILFYAATDSYTWKTPFVAYTEDYKSKFFRFADANGRRYRLTILTGSGTRTGSSGQPWRGIDPTAIGRHWAVPNYVRVLLPNPKTETVQEALDQMDALGRVFWPKKEGGTPSFIQYMDDMKGSPIQDVWTDIPPISSQAAERLGYPTQKPQALLERIISASSNEGDIVLDPFCGCGTATAAAQVLGRRWIGIDITHLAITLIKHRLRDSFGEAINKTYTVLGEPTSLPDAQDLADSDPYQFQWWALGLVHARPVEQKKGADKGVDGRLYFHEGDTTKTKQIVFSVKAGHAGPAHIRDLAHVVDRDKAAIGVLIVMQEPTKPMRTAAAEAGFYESTWGQKKHPKIQILTITELLAGKIIDAPPMRQVVTFKKAPKARKGSTVHQPETIFEDSEADESE